MSVIPTASDVLSRQLPLPAGVRLIPLASHLDERGNFTELFRDEWEVGPRPVQWNFVRSSPRVMRGVHAHCAHVDYLTMAAGEMFLGLHDLRPKSPTNGLSLMLRLRSDDMHLAIVPTGVAHGFYFPVAACHIYAVSTSFDGSDEFGCRWDDPALALAWPDEAPILSQRDSRAGSRAEMVAALALGIEA